MTAELIGGTVNQFHKVTSRNTTGFTVTAYQRNSINLLGSEVLLSSTSTVNGLTVDVTVTSMPRICLRISATSNTSSSVTPSGIIASYTLKRRSTVQARST